MARLPSLSKAMRDKYTVDPEIYRRRLPIGQYLLLLHNGATTGFLPKLNEFGRPIPQDVNAPDPISCQMDAGQRINALQYLVDKALPTLKTLEVREKSNNDLLAEAPSDARYLTTQALTDAAQADEHAEDQEPEAELAPRAEELFAPRRQ